MCLAVRGSVSEGERRCAWPRIAAFYSHKRAPNVCRSWCCLSAAIQTSRIIPSQSGQIGRSANPSGRSTVLKGTANTSSSKPSRSGAGMASHQGDASSNSEYLGDDSMSNMKKAIFSRTLMTVFCKSGFFRLSNGSSPCSANFVEQVEGESTSRIIFSAPVIFRISLRCACLR